MSALCFFAHRWSVWSDAVAVHGEPGKFRQYRYCCRCRLAQEKIINDR